MPDPDLDPLICTYVIEEAQPNEEWYAFEEGVSLAGVMGAQWIADRIVASDHNLDSWLANGYRKHLRRAKTKDFDRLVEEVPGAVISGSYGRLFASELHRKSETSRIVNKLQLSGFKVSERKAKQYAAPAEITVNEELSMSFGKASIASAHAAQNLFLRYHETPSVAFTNWLNHGFASKAAQGIVEPSSVQYAQVEDFGLTEVAAGSITALAQLR